MSEELKAIYLQPECCADDEFGRVWCEHDSPEPCQDGNHWTKYVIVPEGMALVKLVERGDQMPQTVKDWHHLADGYEQVMLEDKAAISALKKKVNNLEQKLKAREGMVQIGAI